MTTKASVLRALTCLALLALAQAACVERVPISGAPCPCPSGYCCNVATKMCEAHAVCEPASMAGSTGSAAGMVGNADDSGTAGTSVNADGGGAGVNADGGGETAPLPTAAHAFFGDELALGMTASGIWLVSLSGVEMTPSGPRGQLIIRDIARVANASVARKSGQIVFAKDVSIGRDEDAVTASGKTVWTPRFGFRAIDDLPTTLSPDGRAFLTNLNSRDRTGRVDVMSTQFVVGDTGPYGFVHAVGLRANSYGLAAFAPEAPFAYVLEPADVSPAGAFPAYLSRISFDPAAPVDVFEADAIWGRRDEAPSYFVFGKDGSILFYRVDGIWIWRPNAAKPVLLVPNLGLPVELLGAHDDSAYVLVGEVIAPEDGGSSQVFRVVLATGEMRAMPLIDTFNYFVPAPDGNVAYAVNHDDLRKPPSLVDLVKGKVIGGISRNKYCGADDPGRFKLAFTPNSRFLYGGKCAGELEIINGELWLGDAVSIDTYTGKERTIAAKGIAHDPVLIDGDRVVFVRLTSHEGLWEHKAMLATGDLVVASLSTGEVTVLARDVDEYVAAQGTKVAFTRHRGDADDGLYLLDLP